MYKILSKYSKLMIYMTVFLGLSSKTFLQFWIFLEMNMLSFSMTSFLTGMKMVSIKYFLIQSFFSSFLLTLYMFYCLYLNLEILKILLMIMILGKLGIPPLFSWFVNLLVYANFEIIFFLTSWQKLLPLFSMFIFASYSAKIVIFGSLVCVLGTSIQMIFKKLLAFSSIFNLLWMLMILQNLAILFVFMSMYMYSMLWVCSTFKIFKNKEMISDLFYFSISENQKLLMILSILALAGIPPFLMFNGKILIIMFNFNFSSNQSFLLLFLLLLTLPMIYFYLRMIFLFTARKKMIYSNSIFFLNYKKNYFFFNKILSIFFLVL